MRKYLLLLVSLISFSTFANEGMWIPSLLKSLNESDMKTMGMKLNAEDIYSINNSSLKDAIVHFGGGCTAEVISEEGLILTNHHCGYGQIQSHSSLEHDYLEDGFWAMSKSEELKNEDLTATFIIKIEDVTSIINKAMESIDDPNKKYNAMRQAIKVIEEKETAGTHYKATVKPFNYGNSYFVIVTETFQDVRLVGAPPSSIGKFGFDTDNWVWPRHTGDFSIFRIYAGVDNKPAKISSDNKPFKPRHSLPVSLEDRNEGDFTMVYGFPGRTQQYLTSYGLDYILNKENPAKIHMRETSLGIINEAMRKDKLVKIQYASKQSSIANAYKKWIGQSIGLKRFNALDKKKTQEKEYQKTTMANRTFTRKYGKVLGMLESQHDSLVDYEFALNHFWELTYYGPGLFRFSNGYNQMLELENTLDTLSKKNPKYDELLKKYSDKKTTTIEKLKKAARGHYKNYNKQVDKDVFTALMKLYVKYVDERLLPEELNTLMKKSKGNFDLYADYLYSKSVFTDSSKTFDLIDNWGKKSLKKAKKDPVLKLTNAIYGAYNSKVLPGYTEYKGNVNSLMKSYVEGLMTMFPDETYFFDANSTLRLTYGKVEGSKPNDGLAYTYYTTTEGIMQKYVPGSYEFDVPEKLRTLIQNKDYGQYAQDGEMFVCFTGSNHTTGGNSGSPCINGEGHLIGLNFDRSWESTMSDLMFNPDICRNIMVDIRYVLFIVDKYAGAGHLVKEMNLITKESKQAAEQKERFKNQSDLIRKNPNDASLLMQRAKMYEAIHMTKEANSDYEAAYNKDKNYVPAIIWKAEDLASKKQYREAIKILDKGLKINKNNSDLIFHKGVVYAFQENNRAAIAAFTKAIDLDGTNFKAYYNRGVIYQMQGRHEAACRDMKTAQKIGGNKEYLIYESICE